ncbi:CopL family metal-binding regulatory protein [Noviluteimonas gilva]|uniref:CopL family metal-binding regulatory protein n=1 Tax=Noviluteimonas gilva TaxID=2682097 RepID=A0A7C9I627_9GAMM|nr:CopL family metal-binding regulatory protein [Lysobacter gilvus]MUV14789.1 CopL family metal-binding regulatory protein [Lysobacter gilvus]
MRPFPFLLRILLCLSLLANGTATAFANARMVSEGVAQQVAAPCHEMAATHDAPPAAPPASHDDCCPPGACLCSCLANATALPANHVIAAPPRNAVLSFESRKPSHASPLLANLIRPPIG